MLRRAALASLLILVACRTSLETEPDAPPRADAPAVDMVDAGPSATCIEAMSHSDLAFIEDKIFKPGCVFQSCHDGIGGGAGTLDLRASMSHAALVNVDARTDADASPPGTYKLVVPMQPTQSYLMFLIRHYTAQEMSPEAGQPAADVGFMPQDNTGALPPLCIEKREAIVRWIEAGAPPRT
ncbi:MAG TPA: hypothetical protein VM513_25475 [Kofleriaceae bacterium]|jgi:hypothetical protein|nr:hypothetical protein [Kofleriaceae bacterium]